MSDVTIKTETDDHQVWCVDIVTPDEPPRRYHVVVEEITGTKEEIIFFQRFDDVDLVRLFAALNDVDLQEKTT